MPLVTDPSLEDVGGVDTTGVLRGFLEVAHNDDGTLIGSAFTRADPVQMYNATTGQLISAGVGTASSPSTSANPVAKFERVLNISSASFTGDGSEACAAIVGNTTGVVTNDGQAVGVFGGASSGSTTVASTGGDDACGIYGVGKIINSGTGVGIGGFFNGRKEATGSHTSGVEISTDNHTGIDDSYSATTFNASNGIWLHATGTGRTAVGLAIGNPFDVQLDVGIGIMSQGTGGPVLTTSFRDDSQSVNSIQINGTHTVGVAVGATAGYVVVGGTARLTSSAKLEVIGPAATADPLIQFGQNTSAQAYSVYLRNSVGVASWFVSGGVDNFMTGTASGDTGYAINSAGKKWLVGASAAGPAITVKNNGGASELGFFGTTTAAKQTVSGSRGANAALASLLTALAAYGLVTDSSS